MYEPIVQEQSHHIPLAVRRHSRWRDSGVESCDLSRRSRGQLSVESAGGERSGGAFIDLTLKWKLIAAEKGKI